MVELFAGLALGGLLGFLYGFDRGVRAVWADCHYEVFRAKLRDKHRLAVDMDPTEFERRAKLLWRQQCKTN